VSDSPDWPQPGSDPDSFEPAIEPNDHRRKSLESRVDIPGIPAPEPAPQASLPPAPQASLPPAPQQSLLPARRPPMSLSPPPKRVRVVLAERKRARRVVRTLAEVEEQTDVGEMLVRDLMGRQLGTSLLLTLILVAAVGSLPLAFNYIPKLTELSVFGIPLPWLLLGFAVYPFMLVVGWVYVRQADRNEQNFVKFVEE
jgi:hypothetical protein